jgi:A/G-specific adenine glycosylase
MLQQTQVARVVPAYNAFLERFPTPPACAAAPLGDVVRAWAGLGYNRRAVNLHRAATQIERDGFPTTLDGLVRLPGVGPYTARAVLAYAYEADAAVVDTNVARVLARLAGRRLAPKDSPLPLAVSQPSWRRGRRRCWCATACRCRPSRPSRR